MKYFQKKLASSILSGALLLFLVFSTSNSAHAWWGILDTSYDAANSAIALLQYAKQVQQYYQEYSDSLKKWSRITQSLNIQKGALDSIHKKLKTSAQSKMITDYGRYLYTDPMNRTSRQMDSYFSATLGGSNSSSNYEGVGGGNSYGKYLELQARGTTNGVNMNLSITNVVSDPTQPFSSGNMQGFMSFLECANNPYCVSIAAQSQQAQLLEKNRTIAREEAVNGFLPTKKDGVIISPAENASNNYLLASEIATTAVASVNPEGDNADLVSAAESAIDEMTDPVAQASSDGSNGNAFGTDLYSGNLY